MNKNQWRLTQLLHEWRNSLDDEPRTRCDFCLKGGHSKLPLLRARFANRHLEHESCTAWCCFRCAKFAFALPRGTLEIQRRRYRRGYNERHLAHLVEPLRAHPEHIEEERTLQLFMQCVERGEFVPPRVLQETCEMVKRIKKM